MFNIKKFNIFQIEKEMKTEYKTENQKNEERDRAFTFKITKKRSPWTVEEDQAISELVNKNGTCNWTLIANEMWNTYGFKNRSGKQCRERWHNHLDPNINKDYWSEKEESILFMKHIEYGNKWSDIAKYLPGRTDNAIKNHFYSKLRKFIRKILKQLNKENLLKSNSVDINKYNSDYVYKIIKKNKMPYNHLNKETILNLIVNHDRNVKTGKIDSQFLRAKTNRKKITKNLKTGGDMIKVGENMYEEKVIKRRSKNEGDFDNLDSTNRRKICNRDKTKSLNSKEVIKRNGEVKNGTDVMYRRNRLEGEEVRKNSNLEDKIQLSRSKRRLKKTHLREDFVYEDEQSLSKKRINNIAGVNETLLRTQTTKNKLMKFIKRKSSEEVKDEESSYESKEEVTESYHADDNSENYFFYHEESQKGIDNIYFPQQCLPKPIPLSSTNSHRENFIFEDKLQRTLQLEPLGFIDQPIPMISPINTSTRIYPQSTKNHFNIDMTSEDNQTQIHNQNYLRKSKINFNLASTPKNSEAQQIQYYPSNKEITLHNKILINESDIMSMEANSTPNFKDSKKEHPDKENHLSLQGESISFKDKKRNNIIRPSIDLNLINDNDISKMFSESVVNSVKNLNNVNAQINLEECDQYSRDVVKNILNPIMEDKDREKENILENDLNQNETTSNSANVVVNFNSNHKPLISPHNVRAFLNISPKSAFMKIN